MIQDNIKAWDEPTTRQLAKALTAIGDEPTMRAFLGDVMTPKEIVEISARLEAARMLSTGEKYTDIIKATRLSSRTVARISGWLQNGCGGYRAVLKQIAAHQHIPPVRAD